MATLAHTASRLLPRPLALWLQPRWHFVRDAALFIVKHNGRFRRDRALGAWIASRPFAGRRMEVVVRSYKEMRRFYQFGSYEGDPVFDWMQRIDDCDLVYDVGSANGLEGFFIHHLHDSRIVFIEPFTPSVETILKTIAHLDRGDDKDRKFEVVQAGCDESPGYNRLYMHQPPMPGSTMNTFGRLDEYARGGREGEPVFATQWVPSVSLDSLHWDYGLPLPTHVKIDIDGFEDRAMRGAARLLTSGHVRSWAIELNGDDNVAEICALMAKHGYVEVARWEHYPGYEHYTGDHIFVRKDLAEDWPRGSQ